MNQEIKEIDFDIDTKNKEIYYELSNNMFVLIKYDIICYVVKMLIVKNNRPFFIPSAIIHKYFGGTLNVQAFFGEGNKNARPVPQTSEELTIFLKILQATIDDSK